MSKDIYKEIQELYHAAPSIVKHRAADISGKKLSYFRQIIKMPSTYTDDLILSCICALKQSYKDCKIEYVSEYENGEKAVNDIVVAFEEIKGS